MRLTSGDERTIQGPSQSFTRASLTIPTPPHWLSFTFIACAASAGAQQNGTPTVLPEVSVTATRVERDSIDLPLSIDVVNASTIGEDRPGLNLSEALNTVPGIVVQNRQNYAQDLQISSRGFGARSTFGVRGIRLIADGIPATMPDGQGQAASFNLDLAERIEVLRGPFASLYGNASGGVIQLFTADGPPRPTLGARTFFGSYGTTRWGAQYGAQHGPLNASVAASVFRIDGYREHSAARRDYGHGKFKLDGGSAGLLTVVADTFDQPYAQDPQGLTAAELARNPRQAGASALLFDTRKSASQNQIGAVHDLKLGPGDTVQTRVYAGERQVTQYLGFRGDLPRGAGGVVDLDRGFRGAGVRWNRQLDLAGMPLDVNVGFDYERMAERRRGFVNEFGTMGALRRDEDDTVESRDAYAQVEWHPVDALLVLAGVRHSRVRFEVRDFFVNRANPDDSGALRYVRTSPVAGITYDISPRTKLYVNAGKGFETPTFAELAYRPDGATGLNFGLRPALSTHREAGAKMRLGDAGLATLALFRIDVADEIVVAGSSGGRTTFRNAARTRRDGLETSWHGRIAENWEAAIAYSLIDARFNESFTSGTPPAVIPRGNRLPGVPHQTLYGELIWRPHESGFHAAVEVRHNGRVYVDDANSESAAPYTVTNLRLGLEQKTRGLRFTQFVRVENVTDRRYVGSVIVAEANRRFFEPAPGRNWMVGLAVELTLE